MVGWGSYDITRVYASAARPSYSAEDTPRQEKRLTHTTNLEDLNMFGMLDYRAHKLLKLFTVPVTLVFALIHNIVLPIAAIAIAAGYATSWKFPQLPIAIAALLLLMIPYQIVLWSTFAFLKAAFNFVIDARMVEPRIRPPQ
jgi:hypothetical protein